MTFYRFVCKMGVFFKLYFNINVSGLENLDNINGGVVLISNHKSYLDPIMMVISSRKRCLFFMAKKELFKVPIFGFIIKKLGAFSVDREKKDVAAVEKAVEIAKRGDVVAMFPQGRRVNSIYDVKPKTGFVRIALLAKAKVVPCAIYYSGMYPRSKVYVSFGEAVDLNDKLKEKTDGVSNFVFVKSVAHDIWQNVLRLYGLYRHF